MSAPRRPPSSSVRRSRGGGGQWQSGAQGARLLETRWRRWPAGPVCRKQTSSTLRWRAPHGRALSRSRCASAQATRASSKTPLPAPDNLGELRHAAAFGAVDRASVFLDDSAPSATHRAGAPRQQLGPRSAEARQSPCIRRCHRGGAGGGLQRAPRAGVPTAAHAGGLLADVAAGRHMGCGAQGSAQPAHAAGHAQGADVGLVCFAFPSSQIVLVWKSVQARHRQFQLRQPLCDANQYSSWVKMLGSIRGRPLELKLPIQQATVHWLLEWRPTALAAHRARLLTAVATLACMRVNEVARLQVCDLWFDYLASYWIPGFEGTCSVHIDWRKRAAKYVPRCTSTARG
jgi:hypothetical protein